uniref:Uncharacterized protein n=1 Tax=Siphoviridae sp. ctMgg26 TaxID=2825462 RepID=A0A8S5PZG6_9CAUD|nr:MAG TPA: hypothetical protein [Siphoviridae sp. ctMgg26]
MEINGICLSCTKFINGECKGTTIKAYTGCIFRKQASLDDLKQSAKSAYIQAKKQYMDTVTAENIHGNSEAWKTFCDAKIACRRLGVII